MVLCENIDTSKPISESGLDADKKNTNIKWEGGKCVSDIRTDCFQYKENLYAYYKYAILSHLKIS